MSSIFYIVDDYWACAWYRCHVPGMELKRRGHDVVMDSRLTQNQLEASDVVVFQRQWHPAAVEAMTKVKSLGKLTVYELDDDIWNLHPSNPGYEAWTRRPEVLGGAETMIREADLVTTTTPVMARLLRRLNKNVQILPNMLPAEHWQVRRERPADYDRVAIGWAGSASRGHDVGIIKHVVPQLLDRYPQVDFLLAGDDSNMVFAPHERIRGLEPSTIERYPLTLAEFDIGLAPIIDSRFNQAKSDLKFVEYGMLGIPTVASFVEPYVRSIVNTENGFLAKNDKDWLKYLVRLIEQPDLRERVGARAKEFAETRTIDKNIGLWEKAYGLEESGGQTEDVA